MKSRNSEFLSNLLSKYSEFEGILHWNKEGGSTKKKIKIQAETQGATPEMIAYGVQQKALNILAEISSIVSARSEGKKYQGKEWEERMSRVISKFLKKYPKLQDVYREELGLRGKMGLVKAVSTIDNLLDEIGVSVGEILSQSQSFIPDIYRTSAKAGGDDVIVTGSGNGLEEVRTAPKYEILMQVLSSLWVDPRNVSVIIEKIDPKRMRKYPYKIVHIVWVPHPVTLTVSDEIGQSTYIYPWYVDLSQFIEAKKGATLSGIRPEEVIYGDKYREGLERVIGGVLQGEVKKGNSKEMKEKNLSEISSNLLTQSNLTPEILRYQAILLSHKKALKEVGIEEKNIDDEMVWCFDQAKGRREWPNIGERSLRSFPNAPFNKTKGIGDKNGVIENPQELAKMFESLWLRVATEEEYILFWRKELLSCREALRWVGIEEKKIGAKIVWYFNEAKGRNSWPNIWEKNLASFPNAPFNKTKGIGDKNGVVENPQDLAKMFEILWLRVATEEESHILQNEKWIKQIPLWRKELLSCREALRWVGIEEKNIGNRTLWCFDQAKGRREWPNIWEKNLASFPNAPFNKTKGIGNKNGEMKNPQDLAKMFEILWLRVATEEEYILFWRKELLSCREALRWVGIEEKNIGNRTLWCFDQAKGRREWPKIEGKNLLSFPNAPFNKTKGIGDKNGSIQNPQELAKMFEALGLQVKHPEKNKKTH